MVSGPKTLEWKDLISAFQGGITEKGQDDTVQGSQAGLAEA